MYYVLKKKYDHSESYNCRKPETLHHEVPFVDYEIVISDVAERDLPIIQKAVDEIYNKHLEETTANNLKHHHVDDED